MYPFERFTEKAKKVLTLAQDEAEKSHHSYIGTEHLLLGLLREGEGLAAKVLGNLGVEIDKVRDTIDSVLGPTERIIVQQIIPTSRVKKVIEIAFEEAKRMNNTYVGTEHLLLGLLIHGEGIAAHVLEDLGANLDKVRHELDSLLKEQGLEEQGLEDERAWPKLGVDLRDLTSEAKSAVALAEEEAVKAAAVYIGPEHLVLGLLRQGEGLASRALTALGLDLGQARTELRREPPPEALGAVPAMVPGIGFWTVVEAARKDARRARLAWVDTDHLLLAIVASPYDAGIRLLSALGVTGPAIAEKLETIRGGPSG